MTSISLLPRPFWPKLSMFDEDEENSLLAFTTQSGVTISEDEGNVYVAVSLPGIEEKDIDVTFDKGMLWVKGESREEEADKKKKFYRRAASSFSYRVLVPGDLDLNVEPEAVYKNGVMKVRFAKLPTSKPKKIAVRAAKQ